MEKHFPETNTPKEKAMNAFVALSQVDRIRPPSFEHDSLLDLAFDETKGVSVYI